MSLADDVLLSILQFAKTEEGSKIVAKCVTDLVGRATRVGCIHPWNRLLWMDSDSARCLQCGVRLVKK